MTGRIDLFYDTESNKAYRVLNFGFGFGKVHYKEVKTNTGRAKMNERIQTMEVKEWITFSNKFIPIHKAKHLPMMSSLTKSFKELNLTT